MEQLKEYTLWQKVEFLCAERDYIALNELYHQFIEEVAHIGFLPLSGYIHQIMPNNVIVTELYRCKFDFKFISDSGNNVIFKFLPKIDASVSTEVLCDVNVSVYSIMLSLAILKEAPELFTKYARHNILFFGRDDFDSKGNSGAEKIILSKYLNNADITRWYQMIENLRGKINILTKTDNLLPSSTPKAQTKKGKKGAPSVPSNAMLADFIASQNSSSAKKGPHSKASFQERDKWPALHMAAYNGDLAHFTSICLSGANLNEKIKDGRTVLHLAVQNRHLDIVKYLIEELNFPIDVQERMDNMTPLHRAIENNDLAMIDYLITHGAAEDNSSINPLCFAAASDRILVVKYLINHKFATVNTTDKYNKTPLYYAVLRNNFSTIYTLVNFGANMHITYGEEASLLAIVCNNCSSDIVRYMLSEAHLTLSQISTLYKSTLGSCPQDISTYIKSLQSSIGERESVERFLSIVNSRAVIKTICSEINISKEAATRQLNSGKGITPFGLIELERTESLSKLILTRTIDVNIKNRYGYSLLHLACDKGNEEMAKLLIIAGADVNSKDGTQLKILDSFKSYGETPLHRATAINNLTLTKMLIEAGAKPNCFDYYHSTPVHYACKHLNLELLKYLYDHGAKLTTRDDDGCEPLLHCVCPGGELLIEFLLSKGADINCKTNTGETPLHRATKIGSKELVTLLANHKADINIQDNNYMTALHLAVESHNGGMISLLSSYGADHLAKDATDRTPIKMAERYNLVDYLVGV